MLTKQQIARSFAVLLICLLAMNAVVAHLTRNSLPRRLMRHANEARSATVIALGNSLMFSGFNEILFDQTANLKPQEGAVNLALGSTLPVEHLLIFRYAVAHGMHPRLAVYGFYDFQLTDPNAFSTGDLIGNHAMLYYFEPLYARRFYSLSPHDSVEFHAMRFFPLMQERGAVWAKVELFRRGLGQQGMPIQQSNQFGRVSDFSLLESANAEEFQRRSEDSMNRSLAAPVAELFKEAHDSGLQLVLVEMPMTQQHVQRFYSLSSWSQYIDHIKTLARPYNAQFIDASDWVADDALFQDSLHLTADGATQFSRRLAQLIRRSPQ